MAIGRFRHDPEELTAAEREVVAAQYPEGALVAGMGLGIAASMLFSTSLVFVGPMAGGLAGYVVGRRFRNRRLRRIEEPTGPSAE